MSDALTTTARLAVPDPGRRAALKAGTGLGLGALGLGSMSGASAAPLLTGQVLSRWAAWLDALVPGAAAAGAADYLATQLALPAQDSSLFLRYMDWPGSAAAFYRDGLAAVDALARRLHGRDFAGLDSLARASVIDAVAAGQPDGWAGPPAGLFYFVCKADGADLVFGTRAGIERLGLDYRAHIEPPTPWPGARRREGRARA